MSCKFYEKISEAPDVRQCCWLIERGYGSWSEISQLDEQTRMSLFYASISLSNEWDVDWNNGSLSKRRAPST